MTPHSREKRGRDALKAGNTLTGFKDITESQGQNLVMNVFCVPFSLDSCIAEKVGGGGVTRGIRCSCINATLNIQKRCAIKYRLAIL